MDHENWRPKTRSGLIYKFVFAIQGLSQSFHVRIIGWHKFVLHLIVRMCVNDEAWDISTHSHQQSSFFVLQNGNFNV